MTFNIFIGYGMGRYNILAIPERHVDIIVKAWLKGEESFFLSGEKYQCKHFNSLKIFKNEAGHSKEKLEKIKEEYGQGSGFFNHSYFTPNQLNEFGEDITDETIGDRGYGSEKDTKTVYAVSANDLFISNERINDFKKLEGSIKYDLKKLIKICHEINDNYINENFYSVSLLIRTILNHIPPAFKGKESFEQVLAELNGKKHQTRKEIFSRLQDLQRKLADLTAHEKLRENEPSMDAQDVQFIPEINFLLKEAYQELASTVK